MKNFEDKLEKLESISETMRTESLPLDKAMKLFEEGTALVLELDKEISKAERKVEKLLSPPTEEYEQDPVISINPVQPEKSSKKRTKKVETPVEEEPLFELFLD